MRKILSIIAVCTLILLLSGCKEKHISEYHGWIAIEMHQSYKVERNIICICNTETLETKELNNVYDYDFKNIILEIQLNESVI